MHHTTLADVIADRTERGLSDLLLIIFDAGVAMGLGVAPERTASDTTTALIATIRDRWFLELEASRTWRRLEHPDLRPESIPPWLRAAQEREALADSRPPESWLLRTANEGKP